MRNRRPFLTLVSCALVAGVLAADDARAAPRVLMTAAVDRPGNTFPGVPGRKFKAGTSTFSKPSQSPNGRRWALKALQDTGSTATDEAILAGLGFNAVGFRPVIVEGAPNPVDISTTLDTFGEALGIDDNGQVAFRSSSSAPTASDAFVLKWNGSTLLPIAREGDGIPASVGLLAGTTFGATFDSISLLADGRVSFRNAGFLGVTTGTSTTGSALLLGSDQVTFDPAVAVASSSTASPIPVTEPRGQLVAGPSGLSVFATDRFHVSSDGGTILYYGDLAGPTTSDIVAVLNGTVVAQEGAPLPNAPALGTVSGFSTSGTSWAVSRAGGHWILRGYIGGTSSSSIGNVDFVLVDGQVVAKSGDPVVPGSPLVWDDAANGTLYFTSAIGNDGSWVIGGFTRDTTPGAVADTTRDYLYVRGGPGGAAILVREGDEVDLDRDGAADPGTRVHLFNDNDVIVTPEGDVVFEAEVRFADGAGAFPTTGQQTVLGLLADRSIAVEQPAGTPLVHQAAAAGGRAFGDVPEGNVSTPVTVTLRNTGARALVVAGLELAGANSAEFRLGSVPSLPLEVAAGAVATFTVAFAPTGQGARSATLLLHHDATNVAWPFEVALSGNGVPRPVPNLVVTAAGAIVVADEGANGARVFGEQRVGTPSPAVEVELRNTGTAACAIATVTLTGPDAADFRLQGLPTLPAGLSTSGVLPFDIVFQPGSTGAKTASVRLTHTCTNVPSPFQFAVSGSGASPELVVLDPAGVVLASDEAQRDALRFASTRVGEDRSLVVTLRNDGSLPVTATALVLGGANPSEFSIDPLTDMTPTLASGGSVSLTLRFSPTARGVAAATLEVTHDDPLRPSPFVVRLTGQGLAPEFTATRGGATFASGTTVDLGNVLSGESSEVLGVLVRNAGDAPLVVGPVTVTGDLDQFDRPGFPGANESFTLAPGAERLLEAVFRPNRGGTARLDVSVAHDAGGPFTFAVSGNGLLPPVLQVLAGETVVIHDAAPTGPLAIGDVLVSATRTVTLQLRNGGSGAIAVSALEVLGGAGGNVVQVESESLPLAVGSAPVEVRLVVDPDAVGEISAVLQVTHDAAGQPSPFVVKLSARAQVCLPGDDAACEGVGEGTHCVAGNPDHACGCANDDACGSADSGRVCDVAGTRRCLDGCSAEEGRNGCPQGLFCTVRSGTSFGACTVACAFDEDCAGLTPPRPFCGTGLDAPEDDLCVACRTDGDCNTPTPACSPDTFTCGECSSTNATACDPAGEGGRCLATNSCGCSTDADCAADRMCDASTSACVERPVDPGGGGGCGCGNAGDASAVLGLLLAFGRGRRRR